MVYSVCLKVTHDAADAEDASQAVFLTLAVQCKTGAKITYLGPWLKKVAKRTSLDLIRSRSRRTRRETVSAMNRPEFFESLPGKQLENGEIHKIIREELDQLPAKYRMPLVLHYFGGLSHEDLAKELRCTVSALGVRLHRGRKMLGERLRKRHISLEGPALGIAIAAAVQHVVTSHFTHSTTLAATQINYGASVLATAMPQQISQLVQQVGLSISHARIRAATLAFALAICSLGGAAELSQHLPASLRPKIDLSLSHWIRRLFEAPVPVRLMQAPVHQAPLAEAIASNNVVETSPAPLSAWTAPTVKSVPIEPVKTPSYVAPAPAVRVGSAVAMIPTPPAITIPRPTVQSSVAVTHAPAKVDSDSPETVIASVATSGRNNDAPDNPAATETPVAVAAANSASAGTPIGTFSASSSGSSGRSFASAAGAIPDKSIDNIAVQVMSTSNSKTQYYAALAEPSYATATGSTASSSTGAKTPSSSSGDVSAINSWNSQSGSVSIHAGDGEYVWSDTAHGILPGQINSVRFTVNDAAGDGVIRIETLPLDTTLAPVRPSGHHFVNIWSFDSTADFDSINLLVYYNNQLSDQMGLHEDRLKLWYCNNDQWIRITDASFLRDLTAHTLEGTASEMQFFAVSAPEPAGIFGGLMAGGYALLRRRRRR